MPRRLLALAALLPLMATAQGAVSFQINAEDHGDGRYRIRATVPGTTDLREAQALLAPAFAQICQGATVTLGRYTFEGQEAVTGTTPKQLQLTQDVQCGDARPLVADSAARPAPTPADEERVRANMATFLKARDAGDRTSLAALYSSEIKRDLLMPDAIASQTAFVRAAGAPGAVRLFDLDWQDDPKGIPAGRYVAVDYVVDYATGAKSCGYVGWRQITPELYEAVHVEQGNLDAATLAGIPASDRDAVLRKMGCRE
ncbi:hypothetical protein GCM10008101_20700 [Lysobacter xinjiangensis]|uniref:Uncharacterized protein n=1 Tax=Cognatilysobacter xinjiangensis TaxID=546892 RepID=A0ABQ3C472_9GAMM|nr:hypothetical protein [Lysobacter xinjiangensis]GGZ66379.1 hypothetical protein GCM10008101_20700 [Lysobacter xinjiangensis]